MVRAAISPIPVVHAGTARKHYSTGASSVHTASSTAASALSSRTPCYRSTVSRYAHFSPLAPSYSYVQCWRDGFFDRTSLHSLGYICYLGHGGNDCPASSPPSELTIIDVNGWHKLRIKFCKCGASNVSDEHYRQLLRMRWYPASFHRPKTAFTFDILETYHKMTLQGKLNLYDFYHAIMQKSDNQGRSKPVVSFWITKCLFTRVSLLTHFLRSTVITRFLAVYVNGAISRVSNAGMVLTKRNLSPR